jgi:tRNA (Thr-GGU) A37 N-methylase
MYLYLLCCSDRAPAVCLLRKAFPYGEKERGIFAIRHFRRPTPPGLPGVRLLKASGSFLEVEGFSVLDETSLIDIKPDAGQSDHRDEGKNGRVDNQHPGMIAEWNSTPKELRKHGRTNT